MGYLGSWALALLGVSWIADCRFLNDARCPERVRRALPGAGS